MSDNDYPSLTARLVDAVRKGRERGLGWAVTRMREELVTPTSTPGTALRNLLAAIERGVRTRTPDATAKDTLYYFYDLDIAPITYDFASYLALAEMERRKRGLDKLHIIIVPGRRLEKEFDDYQHIVTPQMRQARIMDMLAPLAKLLPSCVDLTICTSKAEAARLRFASAAHIWPDGYSPTFPVSPHHRLVRDRAREGEAVFPVFKARCLSSSHCVSMGTILPATAISKPGGHLPAALITRDTAQFSSATRKRRQIRSHKPSRGRSSTPRQAMTRSSEWRPMSSPT